jgi:hypothetical protein
MGFWESGRERKKEKGGASEGVVVRRGFTKKFGGGERGWSYRKDWIVLDGGPTIINKESSFSSFYR